MSKMIVLFLRELDAAQTRLGNSFCWCFYTVFIFIFFVFLPSLCILSPAVKVETSMSDILFAKIAY